MKEPILEYLAEYNELLVRTIASRQSSLKQITTHLLNPSGKQMRPILTLLMAQIHGPINRKTMAAAILFEMIHWATLIHDDVVDEAYMRRSELTLNAMVRSKTAVLVGDYLFTRGLALNSREGNYHAIDGATSAIELVVDGELKQSEFATKLTTVREDYFEIIRLKTAVLIAYSAREGAASIAGVSPLQIERSYHLGEMLGMAFQIQDDILDIEGAQSGKAKCNDLKERKITLPLIIAMEQAGRSEALKHLRRAAGSKQSLEWLLGFIAENKGVEQSRSVMMEYHNRALECIESYEPSPTRDALMKYADFVVGRNV